MAEFLTRDLGEAARALRRAPLYAFAAVLSLALAIGGTTAAFAIIDNVLERQVAWPHPGTLFFVGRHDAMTGEHERAWSYPRLQRIRQYPRRVLGEIAGVGAASVLVTAGAGGENEPRRAEFVTPDYFGVVQVRSRIGATSIGTEGADPLVAVVSDRLARRLALEGAPLIGSTLRVNGVRLSVVGVAPEGFRGVTGGADLWIPILAAPQITGFATALSQYNWAYAAITRVRPSTARDRANELVALERALGLTGVRGGAMRLELVSPQAAAVQARLRALLVILLGAAACVLLLACVNVAGLSVARTVSQIGDTAVRVALGASTARLVRRALAQGMLIATVAAGAGLLLSRWIVSALWSIRPTVGADWVEVLVRAEAPSLDAQVVWFVLVTCALVTALIVALPVAELQRQLSSTRTVLTGLSGNPMHAGRGRTATRRALAAVQMGLAFVLVLSALLLTSGLRRLRADSYGFTPDGVLTARLRLPRTRFDAERARQVYATLVPRVEAIPGVIAAGVDNTLPLSTSATTAPMSLGGARDDGGGADGTSTQDVRYHTVSPHYFDALGVRVRAGRVPSALGASAGVQDMVVNETAVRRFWPSRSPIAQSVEGIHSAGLDGTWRPATVVGVVGDVDFDVPGAPPAPDVFVPIAADPPTEAVLLVRAHGDPASLAAAVRRVIHETDTEVLLYDVASLRQRIEDATAATGFMARVVTAYAILALVIALVGVYSVISYDVARRTREFGVRSAIGASRRAILLSVFRDGLQLTGFGVACGVLASVGATRVIAHGMPGIASFDVRVHAVCLAFFAVTGLAASLIPALRATRIDPATALRVG